MEQPVVRGMTAVFYVLGTTRRGLTGPQTTVSRPHTQISEAPM